MVTGNSIDNLTSYHPQRWASKSVPNSRVKNVTAETTAFGGKRRVLASPTVLQKSALLSAAFCHGPHRRKGCHLPKCPGAVASSHLPAPQVSLGSGEGRQCGLNRSEWKQSLQYLSTKPEPLLRTEKPGVPASQNAQAQREVPGTPAPRSPCLCHGEHWWQPAPPRPHVHNKTQVSAKHPGNPSSQLLYTSSNWKQLASPVWIQDHNTNYNINLLNTFRWSYLWISAG